MSSQESDGPVQAISQKAVPHTNLAFLHACLPLQTTRQSLPGGHRSVASSQLCSPEQ